jgi:hypothetical protein
MAVKVVRLVTGEEIIGDVTETDQTYKIKKPAAFQMVSGKTGKPQLAMVPGAPMSKENVITIGRDKVMYVYFPVTELENNYSKAFGSGLLTVGPELIT